MTADQVNLRRFGSPSGKPPILLTHGFTCTSDLWKDNVGPLSEDREVLTWDLPGHGLNRGSNDPESFSLDSTIDRIGLLLDGLDADRVILGGMSAGGYISLAFAERFPERVAGLVLVDTGPGFKRDESREGWNAMIAVTADEFDTKGLEALPDDPGVSRDHAAGAAGLVMAARGFMTHRDSAVYFGLPDLRVPALVVVGEHDGPSFLASAEVMAAKLPQATKVVIEDAGHAANLEKPEAFNQTVLAWLKNQQT